MATAPWFYAQRSAGIGAALAAWGTMHPRHGSSHGQFHHLRHPWRGDPYRSHAKPSTPCRCRCGVAFDGTHWVHGANRDLPWTICPACRRSAARDPAGVLRLEGVPAAHRQEVIAVLSHAAAAERAEHPLERPMGLHDAGSVLEVPTTGVHCLRRMAAAVLRAWRQQLVVLPADERTVRLGWHPAGSPEP